MRRPLISVILAGVILVGGLSSWPVLAQTPPPACQIAPVFLMLRDLIGRERVGECVGAMARNDAGDVNQPTTRGILTFRTTDLVTAFSDGQTTWLFGPNGLESRPTGTRLAWENTLPAVAPAPAAPVAAQAAPPPPAVPLSPTPISNLPITIDGDDSRTTKAIQLPAGDFAVDWKARLQRGRSSCYVGIRLRQIADQGMGQLLFHATVNTSNDRSTEGETSLLGITPGTYVLDVMTTGCDWEVTIRLP